VVAADDTKAGPSTRRPVADLDTETLKPARAVPVDGAPTVPGLTVLCHPDPERIGEQAHLHPLMTGDQQVALSRTEPGFRLPGASSDRPLADPYISRSPVHLRRLPAGGIEIIIEPDGGSLRLGSEPLRGRVVVAETDLRRGVVLELAERVSLLLHELGMPRRGDRPSLGLVGASEAMETLRREVENIAAAAVPVLLRGESGTGKELVASAIHARSQRRDHPYLCVNMAAVPATTAASELFGHARGAFTGATRDRGGIFARADGGTLFLDEVGDTPVDVQVMLLRVLETGEIQPVGGGRQPRRVDVRLVAATESDLEEAVAEGRFRLAFFHRLAGYEIRLPPLRQRRDDVPRLLVHFLEDELEALGKGGRLTAPLDRRAPPPLPAPLVSRLVRHPWPGNVRQLRNVARLLAISWGDEPALRCTDSVERLLSETGAEVALEELVEGAEAPEPVETPAPPAEITEGALREALRECGFRAGAAARHLGIGRTSIYRLMERYGSFRKAVDIPDDELRQSHRDLAGDVEAMAERLEVSLRALKLRLRRLDLDSE